MAKFSYITILVLAALQSVFAVPLVSRQSQFNSQDSQVFGNNGNQLFDNGMGGGNSMMETGGDSNWVGQDWNLNQFQNQNGDWQAQDWNTNQPQNQHGMWEAQDWNMPGAQGNGGMDGSGQRFDEGSNNGFH
ncbi:hypothetical protein PCANC_17837 [Puccinia coronata f. sp. avenae]|uniref:Uncharacterized protein n=1 Tax=Puccinia coronata f. sp. avenae TaxID=200324 RepID=A0A2N5V3L2_9BASI|nr:hypothetical protein PCANC_17837 [Puccinia coronata f. sp. avenae]PLW17824.1 hypothetical protein PCASD_19225 [Puccinia coronata f. sp. avenae]PLW44592.1 hypothetical protein PCASD_05173 [Puccinia coronata f. sp. avenae]